MSRVDELQINAGSFPGNSSYICACTHQG